MAKTNTKKLFRAPGFTLVELLIVIVVIAILASITIVAYSGIKQRATNASVVSAARQSLQAIQVYMASTGEPPAVDGQFFPGASAVFYSCITTESGCARHGSRGNAGAEIESNPTFDNNMQQEKISLPRSVITPSGAAGKGVYYNYQASRTFNGELAPMLLIYHLQGQSQDCGLSGVTEDGIRKDGLSSSSNYTFNLEDENQTYCVVSIPS